MQESQSLPLSGDHGRRCLSCFGRPVLHQDSGAVGRPGDQSRDAGHGRRLAGLRAVCGRQVALFSAINHDKQSIALNLKQPADREIFEQLLGIADVVVENFSARDDGTAGLRLGNLARAISESDLRRGLGFRRYRPLYQTGGLRHGCARNEWDHEHDRPAGRPADSSRGFDLRSELGPVPGDRPDRRDLQAEPGGGAVKVDVAMLDSQVAMLQSAVTNYMRLGEIARPEGSRHPEIAPFQVYTTGDGYLVIAAGNDHLFGLMAQAMERPDLLENPNFKTNALRRAHVEAARGRHGTDLAPADHQGVAGRSRRRGRPQRPGEFDRRGRPGPTNRRPPHDRFDLPIPSSASCT